MQATQSSRASGSWRRKGQFAAPRYVSRHLEIDAGLNVGDSIKWERGSRWELLRAVDEPSLVRVNARTIEKRDRACGAQLSPQRAIACESGAAGWNGC